MSFLTEVSGPPIAEAPSPHWIFDKIAEHAKHSPGSIAFAIDHQNSILEYRYADVLVQDLRDGRDYVITHGDYRHDAEVRQREIFAAFDRAAD